ncbi:hypothetical protein Ccrd_003540 [Cynara cardunculus var. scolymus]|uniref:Uncharacterized protein n=1 Tax=Cynara cardunculus var. scolymus TaxID=59895 RepID=A0A118JWC9_CYNCS|nr:hypothetical protein Ccrd_003540 [Cynara cardunculus var. scolymus]
MPNDRELVEQEGRSEMEFTDLQISADSIDVSVMFHVVMEILGFVLFMHQQIPAVLQDEAVLAQTEMKASQRRVQNGRKREVKHGIKRFEKLMKTVASIQTALQLVFSEMPHIETVILVFGGSPVRPRHVYELCFSHGSDVLSEARPSKLFLLVKASCSFNMPLHFLPKRDFRYNKKTMPTRLRIKCRNQDREIHALNHDAQPADSDSMSNDFIWFQCRHVIKGLPLKTSPDE